MANGTAWALVAVLVAGVLAGCLQSGDAALEAPALAAPAEAPAIKWLAANASGTSATTLLVPLPPLSGPRVNDPETALDLATPGSACDRWPDSCLAVAIRFDVPPNFWSTHAGQVEVSARADPGAHVESFSANLYDEAGERLSGPGGLYSRTFFLDAPRTGNYTLQLQASGEDVTSTLMLQYEPRTRPPVRPEVVDLLPDLKMLPPLDLGLRLDSWHNTLNGLVLPAPFVDALTAAAPGCAPDEVTDNQALRCLRASTGVGNLGEGPLWVLLPESETTALAGGAQFVQRVQRSDGTTRDVPAGGDGSFHPTHAHLHYPNLVALQVYEYDLETRTRGDEVGNGRKTGFCLANEGLFQLGLLDTTPPEYPGAGNCVTTGGGEERAWAMGVWPQWFDMYETYRTGQYAEISGVPDGVYEFVVTADPENTILESDEANNSSSVLFRLTGNAVEVLPRPDAPG